MSGSIGGIGGEQREWRWRHKQAEASGVSAETARQVGPLNERQIASHLETIRMAETSVGALPNG